MKLEGQGAEILRFLVRVHGQTNEQTDERTDKQKDLALVGVP